MAEIKIENVVASTKLAESFDLNKIVNEFEEAEYNKKKFPGLVYRLGEPRVVVLIFSSGKLVVTGGKSPEACMEGVDKVRSQLEGMGML